MDLVTLKSSVLACIDSPPLSVFVDVGGWWGAHSQPPPFSGKQSGGQQAEANSTEAPTKPTYSLSTNGTEIVLLVHTTGMKSMSAAFLEVSAQHLLLRWQGHELNLPLPCRIESSLVSAIFKKSQQELTVRMKKSAG
jgi:hypothetical protein